MTRAIVTVIAAAIVVGLGTVLGNLAAGSTSASPALATIATIVFVPFAAIVLVRAWRRRT